jgi:hypothetical protein
MIENELQNLKNAIPKDKLYGDHEVKYDPTIIENNAFEDSLEEERMERDEREKERKEKEERIKRQEEEKEKNKKSVSFFTLLYSETSCSDRLIMVVGLIGSMGAGCSLPLFAILFGNVINNLGPLNNFVEAFVSNVSELCLKFLYVALGVFAAGTLMIGCWTYSGRVIVKKIKSEYFRLIMLQEQGWFDECDPYQFTTKIQSQCTTIENGVYKNLTLAWTKGRYLYYVSFYVYSSLYYRFYYFMANVPSPVLYVTDSVFRWLVYV